MKIYSQQINNIAQRKILSRALNGKTPNLTYAHLSAEEQKSLALALINEDEEVRELIASKITNAIEDAYCDELRISEAEDDAIDLRNFMLEDSIKRATDLQQETRL